MADLKYVWALDVHLINARMHIEGKLLHRRIYPYPETEAGCCQIEWIVFFREYGGKYCMYDYICVNAFAY